MQKNNIFLIFMFLLAAPEFCRAADIDSIKADFLQGNYRRVIFEGQAQAEKLNSAGADELNYILGLSYLKEGKLEQAKESFKRILVGSSDKFKSQAQLSLADTYLMGGQSQAAREIYDKLLADNSNSSHKAAVLYRLSQLELKKGNSQQAGDYLSKLRKDYPLSPELRLNRGLALMETPLQPDSNAAEYYSVQVGFFSSSANADSLKNKLLAQDYSAYLESTPAGYRVKVGRFKNKSEALVLESKLSKEGFQTKLCP